MAPIPSFDHLTLALRALDPDRHQAGNQKPPKKEYTQQERERAGILMACIIGAVILGVIIAYM
jgi:hypothetical protein